MLILAVDTTTSFGSTALLDNNRLLGEINLDSPETHSERLLPTIHFLLNSFGKTIHDIDGFALAAGPGSFTGIRIGMSLIKSFVYASGKPAAPVSTLRALVEKMNSNRERLFCPMLDARKGEAVFGEYRFTRPVLHALLHYVWQGGYPRWRDEVRPDYVMNMKETVEARPHGLFDGIRFP